MRVPYSYLDSQFGNPDWIWEKRVRNVISKGDFTLGEELTIFESKFSNFVKAKYAIGVNSGTDALFLPLKCLGIGPGDEVITTVNTFIASAGAIAQTGATPVFVDTNERYVMDDTKLEAAITKKTKAILPVHYTGQPCNMYNIMGIAKKYRLPVIEDACQAINAKTAQGEYCGSIGYAAGFSLHPLKNLNVWGDGGVITTNDKDLYDKLRLLRNHGMVDRDHYEFFSYNSRLDTIQAAVGNCLIDLVQEITDKRIRHAGIYDAGLKNLVQFVKIPKRNPQEVNVFHLYVLLVKERDRLLKFLHENQIEARIHYPMPLHLQKACKYLGYKKGDFPVAEQQAGEMISLPVHQGLDDMQLQFVIDKIQEFYKNL